MNRWILTVPLVVLTACATPQERCKIDVTREINTIDVLIAETEANLARGFAFDRTLERRPRLTFCAGSLRSNVGISFCRDTDLVERERPIAIDPQSERRKLATLRERRQTLSAGIEARLAACSA
jgi:hypothetical protein